MRAYAGYSINFNAFWQYYKGAARTDYSQYRTVFVQCFCASETKYVLSEGYGSDHVNDVGKNWLRYVLRQGLCYLKECLMLQ